MLYIRLSAFSFDPATLDLSRAGQAWDLCSSPLGSLQTEVGWSAGMSCTPATTVAQAEVCKVPHVARTPEELQLATTNIYKGNMICARSK